mmetsp:Transcript_15627/g.27418  ORF Transcript_15627/g.27418 Transcript_15627/m.27418 type:complete len:210 (+) Transcript_15627:332-961(+)
MALTLAYYQTVSIILTFGRWGLPDTNSSIIGSRRKCVASWSKPQDPNGSVMSLVRLNLISGLIIEHINLQITATTHNSILFHMHRRTFRPRRQQHLLDTGQFLHIKAMQFVVPGNNRQERPVPGHFARAHLATHVDLLLYFPSSDIPKKQTWITARTDDHVALPINIPCQLGRLRPAFQHRWRLVRFLQVKYRDPRHIPRRKQVSGIIG